MAYANVLVLGLVFLSAILLHYLFSKKEAFQEAQRTPLTKENVQAAIDKAIQDLINNYQKFKKEGEKSTDKRIRYRLVDIGNFINYLNESYPQLEYTIQNQDYKLNPSITLEDLNLILEFFTTRVGLTGESSITDPANAADLDRLSNRILNIIQVIQQKAALVQGGTRMVQDYLMGAGFLLIGISDLKKNLGAMKPSDIPILRADLYYYAITAAGGGFTSDAATETAPIPELKLNNLPAGKTLAEKVVSTITSPITPVSITPPTVTTTTVTEKVIPPITTASPTGMKFSELVKTLMSYGPLQSVQVETRPAYVPNATDPKEVLAAETGSAAYLKEIKTTIRDEIKSQLKDVKLGPKDSVNKDLAERSTEPVKPAAAPKADSDALQQGSWFRSAASEGCPYAQGQASSEEPVPPFDMSQYIRKDKIPCWGCTLK
jgi:hypothetical protein